MIDLDLREKAALLRQLAHPTRLRILEMLSSGSRCVTEIQHALGRPQANVSQHLSVLRQARIVDYRETGSLRTYYLSRPALAGALLQVLSGRYPAEEHSPRARNEAKHPWSDGWEPTATREELEP